MRVRSAERFLDTGRILLSTTLLYAASNHSSAHLTHARMRLPHSVLSVHIEVCVFWLTFSAEYAAFVPLTHVRALAWGETGSVSPPFPGLFSLDSTPHWTSLYRLLIERALLSLSIYPPISLTLLTVYHGQQPTTMPPPLRARVYTCVHPIVAGCANKKAAAAAATSHLFFLLSTPIKGGDVRSRAAVTTKTTIFEGAPFPSALSRYEFSPSPFSFLSLSLPLRGFLQQQRKGTSLGHRERDGDPRASSRCELPSAALRCVCVVELPKSW